MIKTYMAASIMLLSASAAFAEKPHDLTDKDFMEMIATMHDMEGPLQRGELTAGQIDWLRKSCVALEAREVERERENIANGQGYIAPSVPCDDL